MLAIEDPNMLPRARSGASAATAVVGDQLRQGGGEGEDQGSHKQSTEPGPLGDLVTVYGEAGPRRHHDDGCHQKREDGDRECDQEDGILVVWVATRLDTRTRTMDRTAAATVQPISTSPIGTVLKNSLPTSV